MLQRRGVNATGESPASGGARCQEQCTLGPVGLAMAAGCAAAAIVGYKRGQERAHVGRLSALPARRVLAGEAAAELRARREREKSIADRLMAMYDADNSGELEPRELSALLGDYADNVLKRRVLPNKDDLDFIIFLCGDGVSNKIQRAEVMKAAHTWHDIVEQEEKVSTMLRKHDKDGSCDIDAEELRLFLKELNDGEAVQRETVDWIMAVGDKSGDGSLDFAELTRAVAAWYGHVETADNKPKSAVCVLL